MRLRLVKQGTKIDFFARARVWLGISLVAMVVAFGFFLIQGLNFGIDFQGGTSIRTQSEQPVDVAAYRSALEPLELGDISITEVFDPNFDENQNVAMVRVQAQEGDERIASETIQWIKLNHTFQEVGVWKVTNSNEHSITVNLSCFSCCHVFQNSSRYYLIDGSIAIKIYFFTFFVLIWQNFAFNLFQYSVPLDFNQWMALDTVCQHLAGTEGISSMNQCYFLGSSCQNQSIFHSCITSTNH